MARGSGYWRRIDLATSLFLALPLFLLYQLGVLLVPASAGADLVTGALLALVGTDRLAYIGALAVIAVALVAWVWLANRRRELPTQLFAPVIFESGIYALTMGTFIVFFMVKLLHVDPRLVLRRWNRPTGTARSLRERRHARAAVVAGLDVRFDRSCDVVRQDFRREPAQLFRRRARRHASRI